MRKGQAAVEYLTTYGWAIFALMLVLGVLFYSGILSPTYLVSEECSFGNNLGCEFALFNEGGATKISLKIHNGFPDKILIKDLEIITPDGSQQFSGFGGYGEVDSGASTEFQGTLGSPMLQENTVKRFSANMTYSSCAPALGPS